MADEQTTETENGAGDPPNQGPLKVDVTTLEVGEWFEYETDESEGKHPAMITEINEAEETISLTIFYKNRIDFISEYQL